MTAEANRAGKDTAHTNRNIAAICEMERQALERRLWSQRFSDAVAHHAGRFWFVVAHAIWFTVWILWNTETLPGLSKFDPFPFAALTTVISLEAIFLSLFILTSQNRSNQRADERAHLDLQVNLLAEDEATKMLRMLKALCAHHQLSEAKDPELELMLNVTRPEQLAKELEEQLGDDSKGK